MPTYIVVVQVNDIVALSSFAASLPRTHACMASHAIFAARIYDLQDADVQLCLALVRWRNTYCITSRSETRSTQRARKRSDGADVPCPARRSRRRSTMSRRGEANARPPTAQQRQVKVTHQHLRAEPGIDAAPSRARHVLCPRASLGPVSPGRTTWPCAALLASLRRCRCPLLGARLPARVAAIFAVRAPATPRDGFDRRRVGVGGRLGASDCDPVVALGPSRKKAMVARWGGAVSDVRSGGHDLFRNKGPWKSRSRHDNSTVSITL